VSLESEVNERQSQDREARKEAGEWCKGKRPGLGKGPWMEKRGQTERFQKRNSRWDC
jgi:hypothetical protein